MQPEIPEIPEIPYGRQTIDDDDVAAVVEVLRSDFLTTGPAVGRFEDALSAATEAPFAAVLNSGTSALHAMYAAVGIGVGDEVITSPLTFAATGNAALYLGARPVFVDVDPMTGLIDDRLVEDAITSQTRAIVAVDYAGQPADYAALGRVARRHNVPVLADAAHSLGATDHGRRVGTLADATALSFHPVKLITTGEGGAVVAGDAALIQRVREVRSHGIIREATRLEQTDGPWHVEMQSLGFNYRMTDIQAALGTSQLVKLGVFLARRREIAARYAASLNAVRTIVLPTVRDGVDHAWHLYVVRTADPSRRAAFYDALRARRIAAQVHYLPVYLHPYYRDLGYPKGLCPNAETFYGGAVSLPMFPGLTDSQVDHVIECVIDAASEVLG
jgi:UDP-4-amino-4,6-dideoxy-N-acetyl-beta-L-altrosamine transaminase